MIQIHLSVVVDNLSARTLYLTSGFEIVGRAPRAIYVDLIARQTSPFRARKDSVDGEAVL